MSTRTLGALAAVALVTALAGPADAAVITGTPGPDVLVGTAKADTIRGLGGADRLEGRAGADRLFGGADAKKDLLLGGPGPDRIHARGHDRIDAAAGDDVITITHPAGLTTSNVVHCGPGHDTLFAPVGYFGIKSFGCEHKVQPD